MPSFKNTFGKEETDKNLTYDNTAFLHFSISISVALIALLVCMLVHHFMSDKHSKRLRQAKSLPMFSKQVQIEKKLELRRILEGGAINKILLIVALVIVTCLGFQYVREQGTTLKGFDPYELLGVQLDTPIEKIKKAYRFKHWKIQKARFGIAPRSKSEQS
jgi:preprotein translocase subunit Sec63